MTRALICLLLLTTAGCDAVRPVKASAPAAPPATVAPPPPPADARTVQVFDTTTRAERVAAAKPPSVAGHQMGTAVASLGNPADPGFWAETDLVARDTPGRLVNPANGLGADVTLRPGPAGGLRVSLAALRLLEAPLAGLTTLDIYER